MTYSDAAKRCSDTVTMHLTADYEGAIGKWVAIRLSDGGSDNTLYDLKAHAIKHQLHEMQCAYIKIPPDGMGVAEAESFLGTMRKLYDGGMRLSDPDRDVVPILIPGHNPFGRNSESG